MQSHTEPWLGCAVTRAWHRRTHIWHQIISCISFFYFYRRAQLHWLIVTFHSFFSITCNRSRCNNVNNKLRNTKEDGQQYCAHTGPPGRSVVDEKQLSATWLTYLDEHTESGCHWTSMHHWHGDRFPPSCITHKTTAKNNHCESALPFPPQIKLTDWICPARERSVLVVFSFYFVVSHG